VRTVWNRLCSCMLFKGRDSPLLYLTASGRPPYHQNLEVLREAPELPEASCVETVTGCCPRGRVWRLCWLVDRPHTHYEKFFSGSTDCLVLTGYWTPVWKLLGSLFALRFRQLIECRSVRARKTNDSRVHLPSISN
jgi:hypothetical protein